MTENTKKHKYTKAFKADTIRLILNHGYSFSEYEDGLGTIQQMPLTGLENSTMMKRTLLKMVLPVMNWRRKTEDYEKKINSFYHLPDERCSTTYVRTCPFAQYPG
jgi:hypothetical protein